MKHRISWIAVVALFGFLVEAVTPATFAAEPSPEPEISKTLKEINSSFKNFKVQIVDWPDSLYPKLGSLKRSAFMAFPRNKPSGKLPLLITLHGAGGKEMSLQKQLLRSSQVKGLALAEVAGKDLILLEPNSSDSWNPDTLDIMLDYVLATHKEIDQNRVYVVGHSMGGTGTWNWILKSADRFAAAAPCGFSTGANPEGIEKLVKLPVWGMVGGIDGNNVAAIQTMTDNLRAAGNGNVRHTAFPDANHSQGNAAVFSSVELVDWMLTFSRAE
jgi:predicted peptidase